MRVQLNTMDEERVVAFEVDPCSMAERYAPVEHNGAQFYRYVGVGSTRKRTIFVHVLTDQCVCSYRPTPHKLWKGARLADLSLENTVSTLRNNSRVFTN